MRWLIILLGLVALVLGLVPLVEGFTSLPGFLDFIPRDGQVYNGLVTAIGAVLVYVGWKKM